MSPNDTNINLQPKDKEIVRSKSAITINNKIPHLTRVLFRTFLRTINNKANQPTDQAATLLIIYL